MGSLVGLYVFTALGVTLGYHRMFTHRAFESSRAFRAIVAVLGSMAMQGTVITWVADHRKHHTFTDQDGDPHSPHLSGPGFWGGVKGLWHAHVGGCSSPLAPPTVSVSRATFSKTGSCA